MLLPLLLLECRSLADTGSITVAILDFESKEDAIRDAGAKFSAVVAAHLSASSKVWLVERAELALLLKEQAKGLSGTVTPESAARIGHLTGAKVLVSGKVVRIGADYLIVAKVMGSETGRTFGETVRGKAVDAYTTVAEELSRKLLAAIEVSADQLVAPPPTATDHQKLLLERLGAKARPTVSILIPEQHSGSPVNDPAAQTEISWWLTQTGFGVVNTTRSGEADVQISGEAFSAFSTRNGSLVSCRARVELKAVDRRGTVLYADRETSVFVDNTEQTAAKGALQRAAASLSLRLLPALVNSGSSTNR
ncbi:MAG: hypothetical protein JNN07_07890 [Verrucomicrobiales bacterium]|nr:hypothetical protein [Verrucomicrobiales bacterium]